MWQPIDAQTGRQLKLTKADWPVLIHGAPKAGSSFFTIVLMADLIRRGEKIVFMCAKGDGIRALQAELLLAKPDASDQTVKSATANSLEEMQLVTLLKRGGTDLLTSLRALTDWGQRILVIKNVEELLTPVIWTVVKTHPRLLLSGNFSKLVIDIDLTVFPTTILFSDSPGHWHRQRTDLPTYIGDVLVHGKKHQYIVQETKEIKLEHK